MADTLSNALAKRNKQDTLNDMNGGVQTPCSTPAAAATTIMNISKLHVK